MPSVRGRIETGGCHARAEAYVALQVEAIRDMVEVANDLRLLRIALRPFTRLQHRLGERIAVGMALRIAACAGIAVPVPGAADAVGRLQHANRQAEPVAQAVQLIETRKPGADDQRVERARVRLPWCCRTRLDARHRCGNLILAPTTLDCPEQVCHIA